MNQKPSSLGLRMPAEWGPHSAVWLAWPHDEISFPNRVPKVEQDVIKIISAIHQSERVELLVLDDLMHQRTSTLMQKAGIDLSKISFRITEYMDGWLRDCGGLWVKGKDGKLALVDFMSNTWGNKFPDLEIDKKIPQKVAEWLNIPIEKPQIIIEGGSIEVNGAGICLTTEQCLLNENRNLGKTKKDIEKYLTDYLGVKKTIWLFEGLVNDHTDGHIDELARFVAPNKIVCANEEDEKDENYAILKNNYETLQAATNLEGKPFEIVKLPMPHLYFKDQPAGSVAGSKAPVSYCNFYIGNTVVLVSIFSDPNDEKALEIIQSCFPDRKVIGIDCTDIIYGGGAIHCLTMQQPLA